MMCFLIITHRSCVVIFLTETFISCLECTKNEKTTYRYRIFLIPVMVQHGYIYISVYDLFEMQTNASLKG